MKKFTGDSLTAIKYGTLHNASEFHQVALLNVQLMIALGNLPEGYPPDNFLTGAEYDGDKIQIIMSDSERFTKKLHTE